jgi:TPR repeat protein
MGKIFLVLFFCFSYISISQSMEDIHVKQSLKRPLTWKGFIEPSKKKQRLIDQPKFKNKDLSKPFLKHIDILKKTPNNSFDLTCEGEIIETKDLKVSPTPLIEPINQEHERDQSNLRLIYEIALMYETADDQFRVGLMYKKGFGVTKNDQEAINWFIKAAEQGHKKAQFNLGLMYKKGCGVTKNDQEAIKWLKKSAKQGHMQSQGLLGWMYKNGCEISKDDKKAVKWYVRAAKQGHTGAQFNLGLIYENGLGVTKNTAEAIKWYSKASELGHHRAQNNLGVIYLNQSKNISKAIKLLKNSREQGSELAKVNINILSKLECLSEK